jgi:small subunit ribosomal protein S19e
MGNIFQAPSDQLVQKTAEELKNTEEIHPPEWAAYVKTGMHKQRPPLQRDWWYVRTAAVLRWVSIRGPVGVSKLRTKFGGKKNRGVKPDKFFKASGNILRKILQQLEAAGLVSKKDDTVHKGRVVTPKGISMLEKVSATLIPKEVKTVKPKKEQKAPVEEKKTPEKKEQPKNPETKETKTEVKEEKKTPEKKGVEQKEKNE